MDVTLFEVHLEDAEFNAPFAGREAGDEAAAGASDAEPTEASKGGSGRRLRPLLGLFALIGLAVVARYLRGGTATSTATEELEA